MARDIINEGTRWECLTLNADAINARRRAHYQAELDTLRALTPDDRAWLKLSGLDVEAEIMRCETQLWMNVSFY